MIRPVEKKDIHSITNLDTSYLLDVSKVGDPNYATKVQSEGFTVSTGEVDMIERINSSQGFDVYEEENTVLGYIDVEKRIYFPEDAQNIYWFSETLKKLYFHESSVTTLHNIAVSQEAKHKGIATQLFANAISTLGKKSIKHIFSIVTIGPVTNCPSILWHTKMGFSRACVTMPIDIFGLTNYQSILFYRTI